MSQTTARVIAIETSSRWGSVALGEGGTVVSQGEFPTQTDHARDLMPTIVRLFADLGWSEASATHCFLSIGPGSFTGLRVAVTFARHLALAHRVKICAVATLDVIAQNCLTLPNPPTNLAVILDAKRAQVFGGRFTLEQGRYHRTSDACLTDPLELLTQAPLPVAVMGEGIDYHEAAVASSRAEVVSRDRWPPRASTVLEEGWRMAEAGRFTAPRDLVPLYLRRPEAEEIWERRQAAPPKG